MYACHKFTIRSAILGLMLCLVPVVWAADTMISGLSAVTTPASTDQFVVNQGSVSMKETLAQIKTFVNTANIFTAGTSSAGTWPVMTIGTLLTTPEDGAIEIDANALYGTTDAGNRGYIPVRHCTRQAASRNLTSSTAEQALFDAAQDTLTVETGTYRFESTFILTTMSATTGNAAFDFLGAGTATASDILYHAVGVDNTTVTNAATLTGSFSIAQQSVASIVTAGTGTGMGVRITGTFEITGAGTLIPSLTLVTAAAATVAAGSYFCIERWGATGVATVGQWG